MYIEAQLRAAFPLLSFLPADAALIRRRRCIACITVTQRMGNATLGTMAMRMRIQSLSQELSQMASGERVLMCTRSCITDVTIAAAILEGLVVGQVCRAGCD
jgi:hypothetical protein